MMLKEVEKKESHGKKTTLTSDCKVLKIQNGYFLINAIMKLL